MREFRACERLCSGSQYIQALVPRKEYIRQLNDTNRCQSAPADRWSDAEASVHRPIETVHLQSALSYLRQAVHNEKGVHLMCCID